MKITPILPNFKPEPPGDTAAPTLPFRPAIDFRELLRKSAAPSPAPAVHTVRKGDSLWRICEDALSAHGKRPSNSEINAAVQRVAATNSLRDADKLAVGQRLDLSAVHVSGAGKSVAAAVRPTATETAPTPPGATPPPLASVDPVPAASRPRKSLGALFRPTEGPRGGGETPARPLFSKLSNARPVHITPQTGHTTPTEFTPKKAVDLTGLIQSILEPGSVPADTSAAADSPWSTLLGGAGRFTSGYGLRSDPFTGKPQFHGGIDIAAAPGTEIYPYLPGVVKSSHWDPGHGNTVTISHPNGLETTYSHASELLVKAGDVVLKDTPIAKVGSTGRSTGPHLHFEVRQNNKPVDPLPFVKNSLDVAKTL